METIIKLVLVGPMVRRLRLPAKPIPTLRTSGVLAADMGEPLHRILYVLRTRLHITLSARAGRLRLYERRAMALIRHELNAMDARHGVGTGVDHD